MPVTPEIIRSIDDMKAAVDYPLQPQMHARVAGSRLVYANSDHLRAKLELAHLTRDPDDVFDALADIGGAMSVAQGLGPDTSRDIGLLGHRPPRYGRASIFELEITDSGQALLFDVKGCGVPDGTRPGNDRNSNGLLYLHIALGEVINERILNRLFATIGLDVSCVPLFGVWHLGFTYPSADGPDFPVANLVRDGHLRPPENNEIPLSNSAAEDVQSRIQIEIEKHGLTSTGASTCISIAWEEGQFCLRHRGRMTEVTEKHIDRLSELLGLEPPYTIFPTNIQLTRGVSSEPLSARIVDLTQFKAHFAASGFVTTLVDDRPLNIGRIRRVTTGGDKAATKPLINRDRLRSRRIPEDPRFEKIAKIFPSWKRPGSFYSGAMVEAMYLSALIHAEEADCSDVERHIGEFVSRCFED